MANKNLGPNTLGGAAGYQPVENRNFEMVIGQKGRPFLDVEVNQLQEIQNEARAAIIRRSIVSGFVSGRSSLFDGRSASGQLNWRSAQYSDMSDYITGLTGDFVCPAPTAPDANTLFLANSQVAFVNGWEIPLVMANNTGTLGVPDYAKIMLPAPPVAGTRVDLVYLEVWRARVEGSGTLNKDSSAAPAKLFLNGGVETPYSENLDDNLVNVLVGNETTQRVQVQWALRVVAGVDIFANPEGLTDAAVEAQGGAALPVPGAAFGPHPQDAGLWRAGTGSAGDTTTFNTVDGFVYAIPVCAVFRRNTNPYSVVNGNGAPNIGVPTNPRPDGLYCDQVARQDVLDLRHTVSLTGVNWQEVLEKNFNWLLDGTLHTQFEAGTSPVIVGNGGTTGNEVTALSRLGAGSAFGQQFTSPDGLTYLFTDRIYEADVVVNVGTANATNPMVGQSISHTVSVSGYAGGWSGAQIDFVLGAGALGYFQSPEVDIYAQDAVNASGSKLSPSNYNVTVISPTSLRINVTGGAVQGPLSVRFKLTYNGNLGPMRSNVEERDIILASDAIDTLLGGDVHNGSVYTFTHGVGTAPVAIGNTVFSDSTLKARGERGVSFAFKYPTASFTVRPYSIAGDTTYVYVTSHRKIADASQVSLITAGVDTVTLFTVLSDGYTIRITKNQGLFSVTDTSSLVVTLAYEVHPMAETSTLVFGFPTLARQSLNALPTSLKVVPLYISPFMYVTSLGSGNPVVGYPFSEPGDDIPVSRGNAVYQGEHNLTASNDLEIDDFGTNVGFLKLEVRLPNPFVPMFELTTPGSDTEGHSYYLSMAGSQWLEKGYNASQPAVPLAFAQQLAVSHIPHKAMLPVLVYTPEDYPEIGPKGTVLMLVFTRYSTDNRNEISFDVYSNPADRPTCVGVYRVSGRPIIRLQGF